MKVKVISGGQTGIDQYALEVATELGITTGGTVCKDWITEDGVQPDLSKYGLKPCTLAGYPARTRKNVHDSSITIILTPKLGPGSKLTLNTCKQIGIPCLVNPQPTEVLDTIASCKDKELIINFAGSRASRITKQQQEHYRQCIYRILQHLRDA